jgi:hypothetical protein
MTPLFCLGDAWEGGMTQFCNWSALLGGKEAICFVNKSTVLVVVSHLGSLIVIINGMVS